jgi:hypothetical protein
LKLLFRYHPDVDSILNKAVDTHPLLYNNHLDKIRWFINNLSLWHSSNSQPKLYRSETLRDLFASRYHYPILKMVVDIGIVINHGKGRYSLVEQFITKDTSKLAIHECIDSILVDKILGLKSKKPENITKLQEELKQKDQLIAKLQLEIDNLKRKAIHPIQDQSKLKLDISVSKNSTTPINDLNTFYNEANDYEADYPDPQPLMQEAKLSEEFYGQVLKKINANIQDKDILKKIFLEDRPLVDRAGHHLTRGEDRQAAYVIQDIVRKYSIAS